ncbi:MAG: type II toxin-antitoxin system Phd/YefM family antitoxin [Sulfuricaulis sp.]
MRQRTVSKAHFKAKALEYLREVEHSGEPIIVTDHGQPTIEVRPYRGIERNPLTILKGSVRKYRKPIEPVAEEEWEASKA